jgi:hypothetical protein
MNDDDMDDYDEDYDYDEGPEIWGMHPVTDALYEIRSDDEGKFRPWGTDDVLSYGELDHDSREEFVADTEAQAEEDAADGLLLDTNTSEPLEERLREVAERMEKVAMERHVIREDIMADVQELEGLAAQSEGLREGAGSQDAKEYKAELDRVKLDADMAENRSRNLRDLHPPALWITALIVIGAAAGLVLDVLFVQTAFAAQQAAGVGDTVSLIIAIALALLLAVVAASAGFMLARSVRDHGIVEGGVPEDVRNHYNDVMAKKDEEISRSRRAGYALTALALLIFGFIAVVRLTSIEEEGSTLGLTLVFIGIALVGLGLLGFESYSRTRLQIKDIAEEEHEQAERVLETVKLRSQAAEALRDRAESFREFIGEVPKGDQAANNGERRSRRVPDPDVELDRLLADALSSIDTHFPARVEQSYKAAAVKWLQTQDDQRLTAQIPRFQDLEPEDVPRTALVRRYLQLADQDQTSTSMEGTVQ